HAAPRDLHTFPTRRSSDLEADAASEDMVIAQELESTLDALLIDPAFPTDPYPVYARLREEAPVYRSPRLGYWFVSRYDDVKAIRSEEHTSELQSLAYLVCR